MISIEFNPQDPAVALHIDRYQFFHFKKPVYLKTLPNGKFDAYYIAEGGFSVFNRADDTFRKVPKTGLFLTSNNSNLLRIESGMKCVNIKLRVSALAHPEFNLPDTPQLLIPFSFPYASDIQQAINEHLSKEPPDFKAEWLDALIKELLAPIPTDAKITKVLDEFTNLENEDLKSISRSLHMSHKTMYRFVKKHFSLSPKQLKDVIRFDTTTSYLKKNPSTNLVEALSFGYYDQSHFVKECRKITGMPPKELFSDMHFTTNDLILEHINKA